MPDTTTTTKPPKRRHALRWIGAAFIALILALALGLAWLLGTGAGLRFALARVEKAMQGALHVTQAQGRLAGPLTLTGIRYDDGQGTTVQIGRIALDYRLWPLLERRVHVLDLTADDIGVALPATSPPNPPSTQPFSLRPPVELLLDRVRIGRVRVTQGGQPLFASNRLALDGAWTRTGITLRQLALDAPDGNATLDGELVLSSNALPNDARGHGTASFRWKAAGTDYAGQLTTHSDGKRATLALRLTEPMPAALTLTLDQRGAHAWTATLDAPRFDPRPLIGDSTLTALSLALTGSGDERSARIDGSVGLNDHPLQLKPLRLQVNKDFKHVTLDELALTSPDIQGTVHAHGTVDLAAAPVAAQLAVDWDKLVLPAELAGQELDSQGTVRFDGSAARYRLNGDVTIGPPGRPVKLALDLAGAPDAITLDALKLVQRDGGLDTHGTLTLKPVLGWQLEATAQRFDPGALFAGWDGALNLDVAAQGTLVDGRPNATLDLRRLDGTLRRRALRGNGMLHLSPQRVLDGHLALASGASRITLDGKPGERNDATAVLSIASLGDWLAGAAGQLDGRIRVQGKLPALALSGKLQGHALAWQQQRAGQLDADFNVPDISRPGGQVALTAAQIQAGGLDFASIALDAHGNAARHSLNVQASGTQLSADLALTGAMQGNQRWNGTLTALDLTPQGLPRWRMTHATALGWNDGALHLDTLCLSAGEPQLCLAADRDRAGNLSATYKLRALPLALLLTATGSHGVPMRVDGTLDGDGSIRRNAAGALSGQATLHSAHGSITYTDRPDHPLLAYDAFAVDATLTPDGQRATLHATLAHGGKLDGAIGVSGAQQALSGTLSLHVGDLAFVELLTDQLDAVKGRLDGDFRFGGTLKSPAVTGNATLADFAAEVPAAGLKLSQGRLVVGTADAQRFTIDGTLRSGAGTLAIGGKAAIGGAAPATLTVRGSGFTAADIPAAKVVVSPDLTIRHDAAGLAVNGSVLLDSANVDLTKLPGAGAVKASPDVVIVDQPPPPPATATPLSANVAVDLGQHTHLTGMGLDGKLSGVLTVIEQPGRATLGQGQVAVNGIYKAYGQSLQIEHGLLLFASTPIDNPGLDIKAARKLNPNATIDDGQEVGLYIAGTAQRPVLTVFSNPLMEQSDALSYLITGKPLSQVKGGEGDMLGAAAQALGSATGDLLAKSIGARTGLDLGVSSNEALGGNSAFTVGKYLSPRLYLSYGVGLFEPGQVITLRYRLSRRWNFEAQNATDFNRASLNYRLEK